MTARRFVALACLLFALLLGANYLSRSPHAEEREPIAPQAEPSQSKPSRQVPSLAGSEDEVREQVERVADPELQAEGEEIIDPEPESSGQTLRFRVLHPDGKPAAGAPIALMITYGDSSGDPFQIPFEGLYADDHGRVEIFGEIGPGRFKACPPRWTVGERASETIEYRGANEGETLDLGDIYLRTVFGPSVVGRFVTPEGKAVPGVEAVLQRPGAAQLETSTLSDHEGRFEFINVEVGAFDIFHNKEAAEDTAVGQFLTRASTGFRITVDELSPPQVEVRDIVLHVDPQVYLLHVHPPADVLPSTVSATVTSEILSEGYVVPMRVDRDGVATWNPQFDDHGTTQTVRVRFHRRTGPDEFKSRFTIEPGKIERIQIP